MLKISGSGGGGKSGGGQAPAHTPAELKNTLISESTAEVIDLLCLGPIRNFVHAVEEAGVEHPFKDIYLDETPLMDSEGNSNFMGVTVMPRGGFHNQEPLPMTYAVESPVTSRVEQKITNARSVTKTVGAGLDWASCNAVIVKLRIPAFYYITDAGDASDQYPVVGLQVYVKSNSLTNWKQVFYRTIKGMTNSPYEEDLIIHSLWELGPPPWDIQIIRVSADVDQTSKWADEIWWWSYSLVSTTPYRYTDAAHVGWKIDAKQFGNHVPARAYHIYGYDAITIPDNYDPDARTYTGEWTGDFIYQWTNNPAWVFYWLLWYNREQLGYDETALETLKWQCYKIGQYCDGMVPITVNDVASYEPRWTFNGVIQNQEDVFHFLNAFASTFCAVPFWGSNCVMLAQDAPYDPAHPEQVNATHIATAANVDNGWFSYVGSDIRNRYTVVRITWNDPDDFYRQAVEVVESQTGILRYGWNAKDVVRWGCTSKTEAIRYARWILENELNQPEIVTFTGGLEFSDCYRGCIIEVQDPRCTVDNSGNPLRLAGRLLPVSRVKGSDNKYYRCILSHTSATADKPVTGANWETYWEEDAVWASGVSYLAGDSTRVRGTDQKNYRCILNHTSGSSSRPITGANWTTYWKLSDVGFDGPEWQSGWPYISGPDATHVYLDGPVTLDASSGFHLHIARPRNDAEIADDPELPDQMYRVIEADIASAAGTYAVGTPIEISTLAGDMSQAEMDLFLPGAIWCISSPAGDHGPRYFRCLTNIEKSPGKFQISGCYHDYEKYARIDANVDIVDEPAMDVPSGQIAAPTNLDTLEFSYIEGGNWLPGCHVSWTHPPDPRILNYRIEIAEHDSKAFRLVGTTEQCSYDIKPAINPGTYDIRVRAEGTARGKWATKTSVVFADPTDTPPGISSLQVKGGGTTFSGKNCDLEWTFAFDPDVFPRARFRHYVVIIATDETVPITKREVHSINNKHYTYTWELNKKDFVTPSRSFKVAVHVEDIYGNLSAATPTVFSNPLPDMSAQTPVLKNTIDGTSISWTELDDDDLKNYTIYMDTSNPPTTKIAVVPAGNDHYTHVSTSIMSVSQKVMIKPYDLWGAGTPSLVATRSSFSPAGLDASTGAGFFYIGTGNNCLKWQRLNIASIQPTGNGVIQLRTKIPYNDASLLNCCVQFDMQVEAEATDSLSQLRVFFSLAASGDPTNCYYMADGSYRPTIRLAKCTSSSVDYVAIVLGETTTQLKPIGYMVSALFSCGTLPEGITSWDGWSSYPSANTTGLTLLSALSERAGSGLSDGSVTYAKIQDVSATDKILGRYSSGAGDVQEIACTAAGRALLDDADAATQRATLGLGDSSTKNVGTSAGTVCAGDDSRLSNSRTPSAHQLDGALHTVAGLTTGHLLKATSATTYAFASVGYADVGAAASGHTHSGTYEPANANIQSHISSTSNPHSVTKAQVGLTNVADVAQMPSSYLDTDTALAANSDVKVASQKATKTYADTKVGKALFDAYSILHATTDDTPAALTVGEQTVVGRVTSGAIAALAIDSDLSSVSANHDTLPSAKATKAYADLMLPLVGGAVTGELIIDRDFAGNAVPQQGLTIDMDDSGTNSGVIKALNIDITGIAAGTRYAAYGRGGNLDFRRDASISFNFGNYHNTDANCPHFYFYRGKGTEASKLKVDNNCVLGQVHFLGYEENSPAHAEGAYISVIATEDWTNAANGANISFHCVPAAGTTMTKWLESTGDKIGFFASTPVAKAAHIANPTDLATCQSSIASILTALENYGLLAAS